MHTINNIILEKNAMKYIVIFKAFIYGEMRNVVHVLVKFSVKHAWELYDFSTYLTFSTLNDIIEIFRRWFLFNLKSMRPIQ